LFAVDPEGTLIYVNPRCAELLGHSADVLIGQRCVFHTPAEGRTPAAAAAAICPPPPVFHGTSLLVPVQGTRPDGTTWQQLAEYWPLPQDAPGTTSVLGCLRNTGLPVAAGFRPTLEANADELHARLRDYRLRLAARGQVERLLGDGPAIQRLRRQIRLASANPGSFYVYGLPGSGRRYVARLLHYATPVPQLGALVPLDASTLQGELLARTLQGLREGGPLAQPGKLGTLLLEELDGLPPASQKDLLEFLETSELPLRIIATARCSPAELANGSRVAAALVEQLSTLVLHVPTLIERRADLPLLAQLFVEEQNALGTKQLAGCSPEALDLLMSYAFPGQVAELVEVLRFAHAQARGPQIGPADLPPRLKLAQEAQRHPRLEPQPIDLEAYLANIEKELLERALRLARGNKSQAASLLGLNRPKLYRRLELLGLAEPGGEDIED